jgi:L-fucose mutarotase
MLKTRLLHPEILRALASSGHFSQVLVADGNYPVASHCGPNATRVFLNLCPGVARTTDVLSVLVATIPVQAAALMQLPDGEPAAVHEEYRALLPPEATVTKLERNAFYEAVRSPLTTLVIATGETRRFANILLTMGVVKLATGEGS